MTPGRIFGRQRGRSATSGCGTHSASARPLLKVTAGFLAMTFLALAGACRQDMHDQPKYKPLRSSEIFGDKRSARPLVEGNQKTLRLADFGPDETPRSLQLYGTDPHFVGEAVRRLVAEGRVDHIDMNFGCPVRKVTSKGGGAAIPAKPRLLAGIVRAAVRASGSVPVTIKFRIGIDDRVTTFLDAGRVGEAEGVRAVALHARTAAQLYDGSARWEAIAELKRAVRIPVLGNGDIWEAEDALRMMRQTGCDGVVVGRGCLGRPSTERSPGAATSCSGPPSPGRWPGSSCGSRPPSTPRSSTRSPSSSRACSQRATRWSTTSCCSACSARRPRRWCRRSPR